MILLCVRCYNFFKCLHGMHIYYTCEKQPVCHCCARERCCGYELVSTCQKCKIISYKSKILLRCTGCRLWFKVPRYSNNNNICGKPECTTIYLEKKKKGDTFPLWVKCKGKRKTFRKEMIRKEIDSILISPLLNIVLDYCM